MDQVSSWIIADSTGRAVHAKACTAFQSGRCALCITSSSPSIQSYVASDAPWAGLWQSLSENDTTRSWPKCNAQGFTQGEGTLHSGASEHCVSCGADDTCADKSSGHPEGHAQGYAQGHAKGHAKERCEVDGSRGRS